MASTAGDILRWTGAASTAWNNGANWVIHAGAPLATTPSTGEGAVFPNNPSRALITGPTSALSLNNGTVLPGYSKSFGMSGSSITNLTFDNGANAFFRYAGDCPEFFLEGNHDLVIVDRAPQRIVFSNGTITEMRLSNAKVGISPTCDTPLVRARHCGLNFEAHATQRLDVLRLFNCDVISARDIDDGIMAGGTLQMIESAEITDGAGGGLLIVTNGEVQWWSGGSPRVEGFSGSMGFGRAPSDVSIGKIVRWADFKVDEVPDGLNVTTPIDEVIIGPTTNIRAQGL